MHFLQSLFALTLIFVVLPWLVLHYTTQWKNGATLTREDEQLLDELYALGRRLEERMGALERIVTDEDPGWRDIAGDRRMGIRETQDKEGLRRIK